LALNDRQHVEAVAITRRMAEALDRLGFGYTTECIAARQWLRENHPRPEVYAAALEDVEEAGA
jgi:hypothetical protein